MEDPGYMPVGTFLVNVRKGMLHIAEQLSEVPPPAAIIREEKRGDKYTHTHTHTHHERVQGGKLVVKIIQPEASEA